MTDSTLTLLLPEVTLTSGPLTAVEVRLSSNVRPPPAEDLMKAVNLVSPRRHQVRRVKRSLRPLDRAVEIPWDILQEMGRHWGRNQTLPNTNQENTHLNEFYNTKTKPSAKELTRNISINLTVNQVLYNKLTSDDLFGEYNSLFQQEVAEILSQLYIDDRGSHLFSKSTQGDNSKLLASMLSDLEKEETTDTVGESNETITTKETVRIRGEKTKTRHKRSVVSLFTSYHVQLFGYK